MNIKTFSILALITALLVLAAVKLGQRPVGSEALASDQPLYPELTQNMETAASLRVLTRDGTTTLVKQGDAWGVQERGRYPAASDKVYSLLLGLADLRALEAKTSNPELYSKLNLQDPGAESDSAQLTLSGADGKVLADLLVGKTKPAKTDPTRQEVYVRKVGDAQTWLAIGNLPLESRTQAWLNPDLLDLPAQRVREVEVTHGDGADTVRIYKDQSGDDAFKLADLPEDGVVKAPYLLDNLGAALAKLKLQDVSPAAAVDFSSPSLRAAFRSFDGLELSLLVASQDGQDYVKFSAAYFIPTATPPAEADSADPENPAPARKTEAEVQQEVDELNRRLSAWVYQLPSYKLDALRKQRGDLVSVVGAAADETSGDANLPLNPLADFAHRDTLP